MQTRTHRDVIRPLLALTLVALPIFALSQAQSAKQSRQTAVSLPKTGAATTLRQASYQDSTRTKLMMDASQVREMIVICAPL